MTSHSRLIAAGELTSERVKRFHDYWRSKCEEQSPPRRAAIDPAEIPHLLPFIVIAEIKPERLAEVRATYPEPQRAPLPTRVHFDNHASREYSVLEVSTADRRGLLYAITRALQGAGHKTLLLRTRAELDLLAKRAEQQAVLAESERSLS